MKKYIILFVIVMVMISINGCNSRQKSQSDAANTEKTKGVEETFPTYDTLSIFNEQGNILSVANQQIDIVYTVTDKSDIEKILNLIGELELSELSDLDLLPTSAPGSPNIDDGIFLEFTSQDDITFHISLTKNNETVFLEYNTENNTEYYIVDQYIGKSLLEIIKTGEMIDLNEQQ